jgi:hypothetical protein
MRYAFMCSGGTVRMLCRVFLFMALSAVPSHADLAPKWSDAELLGFSDAVVTGRVVAVATGWDERAIYTYVTLDVAEVLKGWIPERQIVLKQLGGRVDDLALIIGGQPIFTVGEQVLVFLEMRRGDRTLSTTALWQGKWTITVDSSSGLRLATRRLPDRPARRAFGLAVDVRALELWSGQLRTAAGDASRARAGAERPVIVQPRERLTARPVVDVDATTIMNGVWNDEIHDGTSASRGNATIDCFTRFRESSFISSAIDDPCGDMGAGGGTLAISGYWARAAAATQSGAVGPFMQIVRSGLITNAGERAATYLSPPLCADQIHAHELAHAHGRSHADMDRTVLDRTCAAPKVRVEAQGIASARAAAAIGAGAVTGPTFTIAWDAPGSAGALTTYIIEAGSAPGIADLARFETGGIATSYLATAVAPGTYYVRLRAANPDGISSPSNEVAVTVVTSTGPVPDAPTRLTATVLGSTVTLGWNPPVGNAAADYWIEAGSASGLSDLASFTTGTAATTFMASSVGGGTYFVRVRAVNGAGAGPVSNEVRLVVTGAAAPCSAAPAAPDTLSATAVGATVTLTWNQSASLSTSYIVEAGSSSGTTNLANFDTASPATSLRATGVGAGVYYVRVRAKNACGSSAPSNEIVVAVP